MMKGSIKEILKERGWFAMKGSIKEGDSKGTNLRDLWKSSTGDNGSPLGVSKS